MDVSASGNKLTLRRSDGSLLEDVHAENAMQHMKPIVTTLAESIMKGGTRFRYLFVKELALRH